MDIRVIEEMHKTLEETNKLAADTPQKLYDCNWHGVSIEIWRTGMCFWKRVWFIKNGAEIYSLERSPIDYEYRHENFESELKRTYRSCQNCFVEFSVVLSELDLSHFPSLEDFMKYGKGLGLDENIIRLYGDYYTKFFGSIATGSG
ncbi:MAG: hypothetical protein V1804_03675 [Patescibacteria group bacterium]